MAGRCRAAGRCSRLGGVEPLRGVRVRRRRTRQRRAQRRKRERSEKPSHVSGQVPIQENRHNATAARNEKVRARLRQGINGSSSRCVGAARGRRQRTLKQKLEELECAVELLLLGRCQRRSARACGQRASAHVARTLAGALVRAARCIRPNSAGAARCRRGGAGESKKDRRSMRKTSRRLSLAVWLFE